MSLLLVLKHPSTISSFIAPPLASLSPRYLFFDYAEEFKVVGVCFGFPVSFSVVFTFHPSWGIFLNKDLLLPEENADLMGKKVIFSHITALWRSCGIHLISGTTWGQEMHFQ